MAAPSVRSRYFSGNGAPSDANFEAAPGDGVLYVDQINNRVYAHVRGSWLLVDVATATTSVIRRTVLAVAAGSDLNSYLGTAPWAGNITAATYIPVSTITGANTDTRTLTIYNVTSTKTAATLALVSGTDATTDVANALTVSGTAANVAVAAGDVLQFKSTHSGATGLADVGGLVEVTLTRT